MVKLKNMKELRVDEETFNTYNVVFKLNYLKRIMNFDLIVDTRKDNTLLIITKGLKSFNIKYNRGKDLFNIELIKFNSLNKINKSIMENKTINHIKSKEEKNDIYIDQLRNIFQDFFKVEIYNLI